MQKREIEAYIFAASRACAYMLVRSCVSTHNPEVISAISADCFRMATMITFDRADLVNGIGRNEHKHVADQLHQHGFGLDN